MKEKNIIEMKNISKAYRIGNKDYIAIRNINLKIKKGEFVAIIGPSGAGKTTLMNIIGCLDTPSEGEYILDGIEITKCRDDKLAEIRNKKIGFIFQTYNLLPRLNVYENIELPLIYMGLDSKESKKRVIEAIEKVGLETHINHKPSELSGGQMQRVAIARALVSNPSILLADEPTGALDSKTGSEILKLLQKLNNVGHTIVLITHDKDIAKEARRIITIRDGIITSDNMVKEVSI
ncbi:ABC transporter ATP-binding protein [Caloramator sp. CAR-1]|uniref:ABC transporter ATP-binding protein n=1 Tax=Caloramator sp. CAR-1 TaxID=3062777 RepID=UPI0026E45993|nr:ABC transporter ATP-binding protein [Caloramator sp. CAR-1]MDO6355497.1 ABC transporter ATP-binding protein [Caloramator sp. CAR-1]